MYKYFRLYLQGGKSINALIPKYYNSGGKNKPKRSGNEKRGRCSYVSEVNNDQKGVNVDDEVKKIFLKCINKYYLNEKETPLSEVYRLMKQEYYSETIIENGKEKKISLPFYKIPTKQQFWYWCSNLKDIVEIIKRRKGAVEFDNNFKGITKDSRYDSFGPGYVAQADASSFKVEILNRMNSKNVGKPTVYHIVDAFSTMIIGVSVTIGKPSWDGLALAILNIIEDKVEYCSRYGMSIDENEWPTGKFPRRIVVDRGAEFSGKLLNPVVENLGIIIQSSWARRPKNKGIVEQSFNITAIKQRTWLPGTSKHKFRKRGDKDPKDYAKLDILDATYAELCMAVWFNNRTVSDHPYAGALEKEGIIPTPVNLYKWGLKRFGGGLIDYDQDFVKYHLMRKGTATVTERGIKMRDWYYDCDKAQTENWYTKARIGKSWPIDICYDNRNMDNIYFINEDNDRLNICTIKPECFFYKGKTLGEIEDYQKTKTINETSKYADHDNQNDIELNERLKEVAERAERKPGGRKKNSSDMKKDIKESKEAENKSYSKGQAIVLGGNVEKSVFEENNINETDASEDSLFNEINTLRKGV